MTSKRPFVLSKLRHYPTSRQIARILNALPDKVDTSERVLDRLWGTPICKSETREQEVKSWKNDTPQFTLGQKDPEELHLIKGIPTWEDAFMWLVPGQDSSALHLDGIVEQFWNLYCVIAMGPAILRYETRIMGKGRLSRQAITVYFPRYPSPIELVDPRENELFFRAVRPVSTRDNVLGVLPCVSVTTGYRGFRSETYIALPLNMSLPRIIKRLVKYMGSHDLLPVYVPMGDTYLKLEEKPESYRALTSLALPGWAD